MHTLPDHCLGTAHAHVHCQARVWAIYSAIADAADFDAPRYLGYVQASSRQVVGKYVVRMWYVCGTYVVRMWYV